MSDFDELSRRDWEHRRSRRRDTRQTVSRSQGDEEEEPEQPKRRTPLNPGWRKERTARARRRRSGVSMWSSPQEFQLWLQKGGWIWIATSAVLVIGMLIFFLWSDRSTEQVSDNPFTTNTQVIVPDSDGAAGTGLDTGTVPETSADDVPPFVQQPTLTTAPAPATDNAAAAFLVVNTGTQGLFLRDQPSTDSNVLATLRDGTRLEQIGEDRTGANYVWRQVRSPEGEEGWVAVDWLQPAP